MQYFDYASVPLLFQTNLQVEFEIYVPVLVTVEQGVAVAVCLASFKIGICKEEVLKAVLVVEVIAEDFTIFLDNKVATICIVTACPFLGRHHTESRRCEQMLQLVYIHILFVLHIKSERIAFCKWLDKVNKVSFAGIELLNKQLSNGRCEAVIQHCEIRAECRVIYVVELQVCTFATNGFYTIDDFRACCYGIDFLDFFIGKIRPNHFISEVCGTARIEQS